VIDAFDTLFNRRDYAAAERFWSPDYVQRSAHIAPGRDGLFDLIKTMPPELRYEHQLVVAEGDYVILHGRFSQMGQPTNWVVIDVVRVADGMLAEHWDVIEDEATRSQSQSGLPMFGDTFPAEAPTPDDGSAGVSLTDTQRPESQLMNAFVSYLRARPKREQVDTESTREFNTGETALEGATRQDNDLGGVRAITIEPDFGRPDRTVIYFHGGGYVSGSPPERYLPLAAGVALAANATVHAVDYRLAPESRFPAAYDDCVSAYTWLVGDGAVDPGSLFVLGDSAGGNLAVAVTLAARDRGLPLPARVSIISPFADLTFSGWRSAASATPTSRARYSNRWPPTTSASPIMPTLGVRRSSPTSVGCRRCSSRSVKTRFSTTTQSASVTRRWPRGWMSPSSRGSMQCTSGRFTSTRACRSPPRRSNMWQRSSEQPHPRCESPRVELPFATKTPRPQLIQSDFGAWHGLA